jgi:acyl-CoA thioesterase-1
MIAAPDHRWATLLVLAFVLAACGDGPGDDDEPFDPGATAEVPATEEGTKPKIPSDAPLVAFLGDSLSAGLHLAKGEAFPALLQRRLAKRGLPFRLLNAGVSGSTTAAGLARADWILGRKPDVVVVQLGANDGFRGIKLEEVEKNLEGILEKIEKAGAHPVLLEMRLPPNYGERYAEGFRAVFARVAERTGATFVSFFMDGVAGETDMNLPDGIHPTPEGHAKLAENLQAPIAKVLEGLSGGRR